MQNDISKERGCQSPSGNESSISGDNIFIDTSERKKQHLTYDGSVILCVLLALRKKAILTISDLPFIDRETIINNIIHSLPEKYEIHCGTFEVKFDDQKDFILIFTGDDGTTYEAGMVNSVIRPLKSDEVDIPIKKDGENLSVGNKLMFDRRRIQKLAGTSTTNHKEEVDLPRRQPVAGRNAFELRSDLIQMSIDLLFHNNKNNISPEEVVGTAKILYTFVENRNR